VGRVLWRQARAGPGARARAASGSRSACALQSGSSSACARPRRGRFPRSSRLFVRMQRNSVLGCAWQKPITGRRRSRTGSSLPSRHSAPSRACARVRVVRSTLRLADVMAAHDSPASLVAFVKQLVAELGRERERHAQTHLKLCQAREVDKALAKRHKALKIKYTNLLGIVQKEVARRQSLGEAVHADLAASQPMLDEPADDAAGVCPAVEEDAGAVESAAAEAAAALEAAAGEALAAAEAVLAELPEPEHDATYDATAAAASHAGGRKPKGAKASSRPPRPPPRRPLPPRSMRPRSMPPPPPSDQLECGQLPVHTCRACEAWFAATGIATKCEHALQPMGRHRLHAAPATPDSFWAMSFTDGDGVRSAVEEVESHAANPFVERVAIDESCFAGVNGQRSGGRRSF